MYSSYYKMESKNLKALREINLSLESKIQELENDLKRYKNYSNKLNKHLRNKKRLDKVSVGVSTNTENNGVLACLTEVETKLSNENSLKPAIEQLINKLIELSNCVDNKNEILVKESIMLKIKNKCTEIESSDDGDNDIETSGESFDVISETNSLFNDF